MKTRKDYELDTTPPRSIRDIVLEEISYTDYDGKTDNPLATETIDSLMRRVFAHIEAETIKHFKSNELWAIRAWTYENILQDSTAKEAAIADSSLLDELVSFIIDWQKTEFDPLLNFKRKLELAERRPGYIKECLRVATRLVSKYGKKQSYYEHELLEFMEGERGRYTRSSYATRLRQLKSFLDSLPEDEKGRRPKLPIAKIPAYPPIDEFHRPFLTNEEIEKLIYTAVMEARPELVLRLAIATIYGTRVGELAQLSSEHINLDHESPSISIPTGKRGRRVPQPISTELAVLFSIPLKPTKRYLIQRQLKRLCRKAGVPIQHRMGVHSLRRSVATTLLEQDGLKDLWVFRFLRWAEGGLGLGVMPRYIRTPISESDAKVISKHSFIPMWKEMVQFLPYLPQYDSVCNLNIMEPAV